MEGSTERIKGTLLLARLKFLKSGGEANLETVLGSMTEEDQRQLRGMLLPSSWYPLGLLRRLEEAIVSSLHYGSRADLFRAMGRATATANLTGTGSQRVYVRSGDPQFLLRHSPHIYASAHSSGSRTVECTGENAAVIRTVRPVAEVHPDDCLTTLGWLERAIEIAGGRSVTVVEAQCIALGHPCCEYRCEWELPLAVAPA